MKLKSRIVMVNFIFFMFFSLILFIFVKFNNVIFFYGLRDINNVGKYMYKFISVLLWCFGMFLLVDISVFIM